MSLKKRLNVESLTKTSHYMANLQIATFGIKPQLSLGKDNSPDIHVASYEESTAPL